LWQGEADGHFFFEPPFPKVIGDYLAGKNVILSFLLTIFLNVVTNELIQPVGVFAATSI
jgi:hypothetical protein